MDFCLYILLGFALAAFMFVRPHLTTPVACFYWLISLLWGLDLISPFTLQSHEWVPYLNLSIDFRVDGLATLFNLLVSGIGILVFLYALIYSGHDSRQAKKLLALLQLFAVSMCGLVYSNNLIVLFIFWELTTVVSYLLVQFDPADPEANQAAFNSLFVSVIGGLCLLAGILLINSETSTWQIQTLMTQSSSLLNSPLIGVIFVLFLIAAMTKSAQLPFYFWLVGAMKAPTPVSAYLHSATMVNAGIYLLARFYPLMSQLPSWYSALSAIGLSTMTVSSILCLWQTDLKRVLAFTTIFALGAMTYLLGSNEFTAIEAFAVFLLFHGIYKAATFMLVGFLDKEYKTRDIHKLTGICQRRPLLTVLVFITFASMAGLPPFFGFTVKEMVYEAKLASPTLSYFYMGLSLFTSMLIAAASIKCLYIMCRKNPSLIAPKRTLKFGMVCPALLCLLIVLLSLFEDSAQQIVQNSIEAMLPSQSLLYVKPTSLNSFSLSLLTMVGGFACAYVFTRYRMIDIEVPSFLNPRVLFEKCFDALLEIAKWITRQTEQRSLQTHLRIIFATITALLLPVSLHLFNNQPYTGLQINFAQTSIILYFTLIGLTLALITSTNAINYLIYMGFIGLLTGLFFIINGAIDVAITQVLIEILSVVIILLVYRGSHIIREQHVRLIHLPNLVISTLFGLSLYPILTALAAHRAPMSLHNFFASHSDILAYGKNIVNVILVDFRALDTLGEALVVVAAGCAISILLHKTHHQKDNYVSRS